MNEEETKKYLDYINCVVGRNIDDQAWIYFFNTQLILFAKSPAAVKQHHNFEGGLLRHTVEMLEFGIPIARKSGVSLSEFVKVVILHDLSKLKTYQIQDNGIITYESCGFPEEFWILNLLAKSHLFLSSDEINAVVLAHGGWSEYSGYESSRLAVVLHMSDLWSAKIIHPIVEVQCPMCPDCGSEMALRTRKDGTGQFYGCTKFPDCKGIENVDDDGPKINIKDDMPTDWSSHFSGLIQNYIEEEPDIPAPDPKE